MPFRVPTKGTHKPTTTSIVFTKQDYNKYTEAATLLIWIMAHGTSGAEGAIIVSPHAFIVGSKVRHCSHSTSAQQQATTLTLRRSRNIYVEIHKASHHQLGLLPNARSPDLSHHTYTWLQKNKQIHPPTNVTIRLFTWLHANISNYFHPRTCTYPNIHSNIDPPVTIFNHSSTIDPSITQMQPYTNPPIHSFVLRNPSANLSRYQMLNPR